MALMSNTSYREKAHLKDYSFGQSLSYSLANSRHSFIKVSEYESTAWTLIH